MTVDDGASRDVLDTAAAGPTAIRGGALRTGGYVLGLLLAVGSAPLIFRHLGVIDFGRYSAVLALVTLAAGISEGGLNAIAQREWSTAPPEERQRLMANLLGIRIALMAVAVCGALAFAMAAGYDAPLVAGTALAGAGLFGQTIQSLLASPLQADLRFGWATVADLLRQLVFVACIAGLVVAGAGLVSLLAAQIPAGLAALGLTIWLVRGDVPLRPRMERSAWGRLLRDTLPFAVAVAINTAYFRVAILFMSVTATERATGYFATSFRILEVVIAVPPVLLAAAFPVLSRAARDDAVRFAYITRRTFDVALLVGGLAVVCLELGAELAIDVLAGAEYAEAVPVLRIQAVAVLATFAAVACGFPLLSLRQHRAVLIVNSVALALVLVLLGLLVGPYGAQGAAAATLTAEVALAVMTAAALLRAAPDVRLSTTSMLAIPLIAVVAIGVPLATGLPALAQVVLGAVIYGGLALATRRIPPELFDAVRRS